jgi:rhodanese-related sulfurtransferase
MNKRIITLVIVVLIGGGLYYTNQFNNKDVSDSMEPAAQLINPDEFDELTAQSDVFVLDVHTPEQTHINKSDTFIPYDQLEEQSDRLPTDKSTPILLYCRSGSMSRIAGQTLVKMGYTTIYDLEGGTQAYREQRVGVAIEPTTQSLGTVIYGEVPTTTFTLTNNTPDDLNITKVSTSCGCTSATVENQSLKPYESTIVHVSFDPAVHKDDTDLGELTRTIYIETDNINFETVSSTITANVIKK